MNEDKREVNVQDEEIDDGNDDVVTPEDAKSLDQEPESSAGKEAEIDTDLEDKKETEGQEPEEELETPEPEDPQEPADVPVEPLKKEPKPVEGETPREYALRKEVERLRHDNRELSKSGIFKKTKMPEKKLDVSSLLEAGYSEEEIESSKKLIGVLAPAMGFVNETQTYQDKINQELDKFVEEHQEYSPKNDKDDLRWGKFIEVIKSDYNLNGKTPSQLKAIYTKVDRDVKEEFGEAKVENTENKIKAQNQKIKSVSHAGGNKSITESKKSSQVTEADGVKFVGFDDDDLK